MEMSPLLKYLCFQLYVAILLAPKISDKSKPEVLHKFRVAIRRSHSLITLFMPHQYALLDLLKSIISKTNELREIDVFLQETELKHYPHLQKALSQYRKKLFEKTLKKYPIIESADLLNQVYEDLCANPVIPDTEELVSQARTHYKEYLRRYRLITVKTTEKEMHRLRIGFKIARYSFEFLTDTHIKNEKKKMQICRQNQEQLGKVQDTVNQIAWLKRFCKRHDLKECDPFIQALQSRLYTLKSHSRG